MSGMLSMLGIISVFLGLTISCAAIGSAVGSNVPSGGLGDRDGRDELREIKFKTKNIIDGAVFRGADAVNAWLFAVLASAMALPILLLTTVPIVIGWLLLSLGLGRAQERRAASAIK
jgi:hypothetical protein